LNRRYDIIVTKKGPESDICV